MKKAARHCHILARVPRIVKGQRDLPDHQVGLASGVRRGSKEKVVRQDQKGHVGNQAQEDHKDLRGLRVQADIRFKDPLDHRGKKETREIWAFLANRASQEGQDQQDGTGPKAPGECPERTDPPAHPALLDQWADLELRVPQEFQERLDLKVTLGQRVDKV